MKYPDIIRIDIEYKLEYLAHVVHVQFRNTRERWMVLRTPGYIDEDDMLEVFPELMKQVLLKLGEDNAGGIQSDDLCSTDSPSGVVDDTGGEVDVGTEKESKD